MEIKINWNQWKLLEGLVQTVVMIERETNSSSCSLKLHSKGIGVDINKKGVTITLPDEDTVEDTVAHKGR